MEHNRMTVDVIIPVYHPDKNFITLVRRLEQQTLPVHKIILMNTEEKLWLDAGMEGILSGALVEVHHVSKEEFDHGGTRDMGIRYSDADVVVCMTQDAMPKHDTLIARLVDGLSQPGAAIAYACQLPAEDVGVIERYARSFNYPDTDRLKTKADLEELGIKTFFASNVCAAYKREIYLQLGGFIHKTIFNEDMIFAAGAIKAGYGIAYCSGAQVIHSHNYNCMQQFRRNFDLAVSQADHPEVFAGIRSESEGIRMVKSNAAHLCSIGKPYLIPQLVLVSGCKYLGYRMGRSYRSLPKWLVMRCTMNPHYWKKGGDHGRNTGSHSGL